jgi:hypothetical protein
VAATSTSRRFNVYALADRRVAALLRSADRILTDVARGVYVCPRYGEAQDG